MKEKDRNRKKETKKQIEKRNTIEKGGKKRKF